MNTNSNNINIINPYSGRITHTLSNNTETLQAIKAELDTFGNAFVYHCFGYRDVGVSEWRPVYQQQHLAITTCGRLFSFQRKRFMKTHVNTEGYEKASLTYPEAKRAQERPIHQLEAESFLGFRQGMKTSRLIVAVERTKVRNIEPPESVMKHLTPDELLYVKDCESYVEQVIHKVSSKPSSLVANHRNEDKTDNRKENLELLTQVDNVRYSKRIPFDLVSPDGEHVQGDYLYRLCQQRGLTLIYDALLLVNRGKLKEYEGWTRYVS